MMPEEVIDALVRVLVEHTGLNYDKMPECGRKQYRRFVVDALRALQDAGYRLEVD